MNEVADLTDHEWDAVRALVPRCGPGGPDYRAIVNGILWQQHGGRRWHDLPARYGPWHRCAERLRLWNLDGTWQRILAALAAGRPAASAIVPMENTEDAGEGSAPTIGTLPGSHDGSALSTGTGEKLAEPDTQGGPSAPAVLVRRRVSSY
ncbi:transposase [Streptomyces sp. A1136]|uniref:transposase n=1 Tax=Streptomyces sp. A1136 TaxID=2563102 RepID=UPI00109EACB8|nr:transposase [Streptomyces sp. A1136]THA47747.1 transposase [Streptomyces sp. A1136]